MDDERTTYSPSEAGAAVGLSKRRILQLASRGDIEATRDGRGYWRIPEREIRRLQRERRDRERHEPRQPPTGGELVEELRDRLRYVEGQLEAERAAHAEARLLLLAALERIPPQLEASQEPRGASETPSEGPEGAEKSSPARVPGSLKRAQSPGPGGGG